MKKELENIIKKAVFNLYKTESDFAVDYPAVEKFGDYTTNAAMVLAKVLQKNPMEIAESLKLGFFKFLKPNFGKRSYPQPPFFNCFLWYNLSNKNFLLIFINNKVIV